MVRSLRRPGRRTAALLALSGLSGLLLGASGAAAAPPPPAAIPGPMGAPPPFALREMIKDLDLDGDGRVTRAELEKAGQVRAQAIDSDGNGVISAEEVVDFQERERLRHGQTMLVALDSDGDGRVTVAEFVAGGTWRLARLDRNGDGVIDREELQPPPRGPGGGPGRGPACD